jgi:MFS family permease
MPKANKWYVMAAVVMGTFLATIDGSIVNVSLPVLAKELNSSFVTVQWVVLAYLVTVTTLLLSIGRLADMVGKKPLYTVGMVVFTIGSLLCGLSPNVSFLIAARVLQA